MWVKICGNTSLEDAVLAANAGADALGFVFATSPRRVSPEQVSAIVADLPASVEKIGVFVEDPAETIVRTIRTCGLTGVQLHSLAGAEVPATLRAEFGTSFRILRVVHFGPDAAERARAYAADPNVDGVLVDSRTATAVGGTGIAFDWESARHTVFSDGKGKPMIVAGGLNPENVTAAIAALQPWGVDVVSGVEAAPGRKDAAKVRAFVTRARAGAHSDSDLEHI
ncbi:phosphoribosylanthranilate isomerase [Acidobacteria bacterium AB60]|nr:phosphoribosylanthranilate isomerase [Acidobacteria bacterium AB60]